MDVVITRGRKTWGVEVKAATTLNPKDGKGLARLADHCGKDFKGGILLYTGKDILPLRDKTPARGTDQRALEAVSNTFLRSGVKSKYSPFILYYYLRFNVSFQDVPGMPAFQQGIRVTACSFLQFFWR